jgi:hypothetical protein
LLLCKVDLLGLDFLTFGLKPLELYWLDVFDRLSDWQDVQLIIYGDACLALAETQNESFIKSRLYCVVSFSPVPRVDVHRYSIQLLQTRHCVEEHDHKSTPFYCLHRPAQYIRSDALEVLKHAHTECLTKDSVGVLVVAVLNILGRHEQLNLIDLFLVQVPFLFHFLDLFHTLLLVA